MTKLNKSFFEKPRQRVTNKESLKEITKFNLSEEKKIMATPSKFEIKSYCFKKCK